MPPSTTQMLASAWSGWLAAWPSGLIALIWIGWLASWGVASLWQGRTQKRVTALPSQAYRLPILAGALLLTPWTAQLLGERRAWDPGNGGTYALAGVMLAGLLFTWWARIHLGSLWSSAITHKEDHRVIDTGPYRFVRHPIYTGLIAAILATGAAVGTVSAMLGALLIAGGLWYKAGMEERFLTAELDPDAYAAYRRRVPMLVPFLPQR
ncbi:MAG: methyltransferase family protein [Hyphomicrobiales bacterium]